MKQITKFKRLLSGVLSAVITISAIPFTSATAEDSNEPYPYTMFAASSDEGAIIVNADNFCVNGNVATNGTIVSSGNVNINGSRTENAEESMIYIFNKIDNQYFSASNVDEHDEDYTLDEMNININVPTEVQGKATLTGNININTALKALEDPNGPWGDKIMELMDTVDSYIPDPQRDTDKPFLMPVEDVFTITGRGTVATGRVERGQLKTGDEVEILGLSTERPKTVVTGIEMFRKILDYAEAGDNIGALLRGIQRSDIQRGQVLCKPGSIHPYTKFSGQVYVLKKEEGGRHTPFFNNYRPQFYFRTTDVTGVITLPADKEMCMPGDNVEMDVELITPIAIEEGLRFAIREGGRTVGSGVVTAVRD